MRGLKRKYRSIFMLFLILGLCSFFASAQNENERKDTGKIVLKENYEPVAKDTAAISPVNTTTTNQDQEQDSVSYQTNYFLDKRSLIDLVNLRQLPDSAKRAMQNDKDFWYANAKVRREKNKSGEWVITTKTDTTGKHNAVVQGEVEERVPFILKKWFQTLLWIIIIAGFTAFIMVYLANSEAALFRRRNKTISDVETEIETEDIFAINYSREIDKAIQGGDYRLATRLMFLRLLKQLSEKNIIQYQLSKTNLDYLMQLSPTVYYKDFFRITRNYEYSWYGLFEIDTDMFAVITNDFENFSKKIT